jgi:membrane protease YdiL (CAAX protease family)
MPPPAPPPLPPYPHARPEPYHRVLRTWSYRAWRPVVGIAVTVLLSVLVAPLFAVGVVGAALAVFAPAEGRTLMSDLTELNVTPAVLLSVNLSLAAMIPITFLVMRVLHGMRPRWLSSVRPGLRWRLLGQFIGLGVVATVLFSLLLGLTVSRDAIVGETPSSVSAGTTVAYLAIIVLTSPLQAAGEEYVFRGYLMQAFGALVSNRWFTLLLTSLLFAVAHGTQNLPLFTDRFLFGLVAGLLVIYTGGLEAGIGLHIVNNVVALGLAAVTGSVSETLNVSEATWELLLIDIGQLLLFSVLVVLWTRHKGFRTRTTGPPAGARA